MEKTQSPPSQAGSRKSLSAMESEIRPMEEMMNCMRNYAREKPEMAALWCLGIGFVLGWKLKPW